METKKNGQIELKILVYNYSEKKWDLVELSVNPKDLYGLFLTAGYSGGKGIRHTEIDGFLQRNAGMYSNLIQNMIAEEKEVTGLYLYETQELGMWCDKILDNFMHHRVFGNKGIYEGVVLAEGSTPTRQ